LGEVFIGGVFGVVCSIIMVSWSEEETVFKIEFLSSASDFKGCYADLISPIEEFRAFSSILRKYITITI